MNGQSATPSTSLSFWLNPPDAAFNPPGVATESAPGIASTDNVRLLPAGNDLLGIPATLRQYNLYARDEWRVKFSVTITYEVRWEINRPPTETSLSPYVLNKNVDGSGGLPRFCQGGPLVSARRREHLRAAPGYLLRLGSLGRPVRVRRAFFRRTLA